MVKKVENGITPETYKMLDGSNGGMLYKDDVQHEVAVPRWSPKCVNRYICFVLAVAVLTCVVSTALTIFVMAKCRQADESNKSVEEQDRVFPHPVCVQCIRLVQNQFNHLEEDPLIDKLVKRLDDGIQMCCAWNEEQMSALVEATMREQVTKPIPKEDNSDLKFVPVSAHKQLLSDDEWGTNFTEPYYGDGSEHFIVRFNSEYDDPLTEHAYGVTVLDTSLRIQYTGVYYVYFSVNIATQFYIPADSAQKWSQYVHRTRPNSPANSMVLLQICQTPCTNCSQHQESAFAGGTFTLKKDDLIQVCISGLGLVQYRKESSFLGLILVSSAPEETETRF